jgi:hypothetical protein
VSQEEQRQWETFSSKLERENRKLKKLAALESGGEVDDSDSTFATGGHPYRLK